MCHLSRVDPDPPDPPRPRAPRAVFLSEWSRVCLLMCQCSAESSVTSGGRFAILSRALGGLLLIAASLKAYELATAPVPAESILDSRWTLIAVVESELLFGIWLLFGLCPKFTWAAALGCFALFAAVSLYKAASGQASCGCFGRVPINPWYVTAFDAIIVMALLRWRPRSSEGQAVRFVRLRPLHVAAVLLAWLLVGLPAAAAMGAYEPARLREDGDIEGVGKTVLLEPDAWRGKRFPLLKHVNIREDVSRGLWVVLLFRDGCPACRDAVALYEDLARSIGQGPGRPRVAVVEFSPYEADYVPAETLTHGYLSNDWQWQAPIPVGLLIDDGDVRKVYEDPRQALVIGQIWCGPDEAEHDEQE